MMLQTDFLHSWTFIETVALKWVSTEFLSKFHVST